MQTMTNFFSQSDLFSENQFGFPKKRSYITAINKVTEYIREQLDKKCKGHLRFLDLEKAFDTIDHIILSGKVEGSGFRGKILSLIGDYLANCTQCVTLNGKNSTMRKITTGVPQGSFLFLININDLPNASESTKLTLFADDTILYKTEKKSTQK